MSRISLGFLSLALVVALLGEARAYDTALPKYDLESTRTPDPVQSLGQAPDCATATILTIVPGFDEVLVGDTTGLSSLVDAYACEHWDETGPEIVYRLEVDSPTIFRAEMISVSPDLDLFLLSDCDSDSCLIAGSGQITIGLPAGVFYLVVDGYRGAAGAYEIKVDGLHRVLASAVCDSAVVLPVANGLVTIEDEVCDQINYVTMADCGEYLAFGGEAWYRLEIATAQEVEIVVSDISASQLVDLVLWLFDDCGDSPLCIDYADAVLGGGDESLSYHNSSGGPQSILLGIDTIRPYSSTTEGICFEGVFQLRITGAVAASKSSLGGLKRSFR